MVFCLSHFRDIPISGCGSAISSAKEGKMKFSMFECNELVENCFPLFGYAPIGKEPC